MVSGIHVNLAAFLDMLAWAEGTSTHPKTQNDGYDIIVNPGGTFMDYSKHPMVTVQIHAGLRSNAAGRYQLMGRYFNHYKNLLHLSGFFPDDQDRIAIQQIKEFHGLLPIFAGDITAAIARVRTLWASLPGAGYGQGERALAKCLKVYEAALTKRSAEGWNDRGGI
jgi:muramidase (phage lysozyme)